MLKPESNKPTSPPRESTQVFILLAAIFTLGLYFLIRYQGLWGENDTNQFLRLSQAVFSTQELLPKEEVYSNGYAYQSFLVFLANISNLDIRTIQIYLSPLLATWLILPAWLAYREFTANGKIATLATIILLIQPEFLFPILRGSHEKFTRGLMFLGLYLLMRSFRSRGDLRRFAGFVLAFYLVAYALITFNNLMAFSFIFGIGLAILLYGAVSWKDRRKIAHAITLPQRLMIVIGSLLIIAFLFTFYAYPPAQNQLRLMQSIQDRVSSLLLQVEETTSNPYGVVNYGWISLPAYLLLSLSNWILLIVSAIIWCWQSIQWFFRERTPSEQDKLLWAFYGAFAIQGGLSIIVDVSGAIAGNLQHRMFPSFVMLAAPLTAKWLYERIKITSPRYRLSWIAVSATLVCLGILSVLKATNEPLLSNYWIFYRPAEMNALDWAVDNHHAATIWTEFNERIETSFMMRNLDIANLNIFDSFIKSDITESFLISDITRYRSQRLGIPLPIKADSHKIYDNGPAAIFHRRPLTPFQK